MLRKLLVVFVLAIFSAACDGPVGPQGPVGPEGPEGPSTGSAGGDLTGMYPNPQIAEGAVATEKLSPDAQGVALAGASVGASGNVMRFFNRFGGEPTVDQISTGIYTLTFPGLEGEFNVNNSIVLATLKSGGGEIGVTSLSSNPQVRTYDSDGTPADKSFEMVAFLRSP